MGLFNIKSWFSKDDLVEKLNPAQSEIAMAEGTAVSSDAPSSYLLAYKKLEAVNRGVNMIASACASLDYDVREKTHEGSVGAIRQKTLNVLLNLRPNPYQSVQSFRMALFTDFLLEGNAFIYYDGAHIYHLPAINVEIIPDAKTYIKEYIYNSTIKFKPEEIAYFKDVSGDSIYRGSSRLRAAERNIKILYKMQDFQESFFENGAVFGLALMTDNTLSQVAKERSIANWIRSYNPKAGGRKPVILDSGLKPIQLSGATSTFKDLDFDVSIKSHNVKVLETLGVPPVLLDGGNQANISPNLRLFYLETVMPIVRKFVSTIELLTGYDVDAVTSNVSALQPDLKDIAAYYTGLVNGGIITPNEARLELRYEKDTEEDSDKLRIPANIAGSAVNPNIGGAPKKPQSGSTVKE